MFVALHGLKGHFALISKLLLIFTPLFFFPDRSCDTFLPHVFQFLVLLSYECFQPKFNEPKAIVGMPRIIQLCDGIMAGGQPAQSHGTKT